MKPWRIPLLAAFDRRAFSSWRRPPSPTARRGTQSVRLCLPKSEEVNPDPGGGVRVRRRACPARVAYQPVEAVIPMPSANSWPRRCRGLSP